MQNLYELAQIVQNIDLKSTDVFLSDNNRKSKANTFYQKILSQEFTDDTSAAYFLFKSNSNYTGYKNLKYNLREKLINTFFFYSPKTTANDSEKAITYCTKYYMAGRLLFRLAIKGAGISLCQKVFKKASEFELTEFKLLTSKELRREMAFVKGNIEKYYFYNDVYKECKKISDVEDLAEEYYFQLHSPHIKNLEEESDTSKVAEDYYNELSPYLAKYSTPKLHLLVRSIQAISYQNQKNYTSVISVCEEALTFFEKKSYTYNSGIRIFLHQLLICHIQLRDYDKGKIIAKKVLTTFKIGSYNWYINQELVLLLALHSKEYNEAYQIMKTVTTPVSYTHLTLPTKA